GRGLQRGDIAGPVVVQRGCAERVLLLTRRRITTVDRHPGRVRSARGEHVELTQPGIQIRVLELQTGDPAHPPTSRPVIAPDQRLAARRLTRPARSGTWANPGPAGLGPLGRQPGGKAPIPATLCRVWQQTGSRL